MLMVLVSVSCASSDDSEIFEFAVGPEIRDCVGVAPMRCMVGNGELFYDAIEGFDYVEGFDYLLRVERYDAWPDQEEPPQDASRYGYRLIEVISKTRQDAADVKRYRGRERQVFLHVLLFRDGLSFGRVVQSASPANCNAR